MGRTIRLRDVSERMYAALHARAAAERLSLSAYLKRELNKMAAEPSTPNRSAIDAMRAIRDTSS